MGSSSLETDRRGSEYDLLKLLAGLPSVADFGRFGPFWGRSSAAGGFRQSARVVEKFKRLLDWYVPALHNQTVVSEHLFEGSHDKAPS
jgi:hypothetical protein